MCRAAKLARVARGIPRATIFPLQTGTDAILDDRWEKCGGRKRKRKKLAIEAIKEQKAQRTRRGGSRSISRDCKSERLTSPTSKDQKRELTDQFRRKLRQNSDVLKAEFGRPRANLGFDRGGEGQPARSPRRQHGPARLPARAAGFRGLRPPLAPAPARGAGLALRHIGNKLISSATSVSPSGSGQLRPAA